MSPCSMLTQPSHSSLTQSWNDSRMKPGANLFWLAAMIFLILALTSCSWPFWKSNQFLVSINDHMVQQRDTSQIYSVVDQLTTTTQYEMATKIAKVNLACLILLSCLLGDTALLPVSPGSILIYSCTLPSSHLSTNHTSALCLRHIYLPITRQHSAFVTSIYQSHVYFGISCADSIGLEF